MRFMLVAALALHGCIHLLGFAKWCGVAAVPRLAGPTLFRLTGGGARLFGVLWLAAAVGLVASAALALAEASSWPWVALPAMILSQALLVVAWSDAKLGTLANAPLLVVAVVALAHEGFVRRADRDAASLLAGAAPTSARRVEAADLADLPEPARRWLERAGVVGRPLATTVRLRQIGRLRTGAQAAWMPTRAEQVFRADDPGFLWRVETTAAHVLPVVGVDRYAGGKGRMLISAAALLPVVDAAGEKIDAGSALRFLGEIVWFPSAGLRPYISWKAVDATHAEATLASDGQRVSAVFAFDGLGRPTGIRADRYLGGGVDAKLTPWSVRCDAWKRLHGVEIPSRGVVSWSPPGGAFDYYAWEILDVEDDVTRDGRFEAAPDIPRSTEPARVAR